MSLVTQDDSLRPLMEICTNYEKGLWKLPKHQRAYVWNKKREKGWIQRLASTPRLVGCIVTYQVEEENYKTTWINDGSQRIRCTLKFLQRPKAFGYAPEDLDRIFLHLNMPCQHRAYTSHEEAYLDFRYLNWGELLTPLEFYSGILAYMPNYDTVWKELLDRLASTVKECHVRLTKRTKSRINNHGRLRKNYLLLYRHLLNEDVALNYVRVGSIDITRGALEDKSIIEWKLRRLMEELGPGHVEEEVSKLCRVIESETAVIEKQWTKAKKALKMHGAMHLADGMYRFLLETAIYRNNKNIPLKPWESFVFKILKAGRGKTEIRKSEDERRILHSGRLDQLLTISQWVGSDFLTYPKTRKKRSNSQVPKGYDISHMEPVSLHGEGPVTIEPSAVNRSRGAKSVNDPGSSL